MRLRTITTVALALAVGSVAGCGADDEQGNELPRDAASELRTQLDSIQARFEAGQAACADITGGDDPNTTVVESVLSSLPNDVDAEVRNATREGFDRLFELVEQECSEEEPPETTTESPPETETETVPPETTPTETTPTETTPTETTPTETTPTDTEEEPPPEVPPGQGGENPGQGNGGGVVVPDEGAG